MKLNIGKPTVKPVGLRPFPYDPFPLVWDYKGTTSSLKREGTTKA